jgi:hypothetical protein
MNIHTPSTNLSHDQNEWAKSKAEMQTRYTNKAYEYQPLLDSDYRKDEKSGPSLQMF